MMRYLLATIALCAAVPVQAANFVVDYDKSKVRLVKQGTSGNATVRAAINPGLDGMLPFELDHEGHSNTFNFIDFYVECSHWTCTDLGSWELGSYKVEATLAFESPELEVEGSGSGGALVVFGNIFNGQLQWSNLPADFDIGDGEFVTVEFEEGNGLFLGPKKTTTATVTLGISAAPLPAAGLMLAGALAGMGYAARRRRRS